MKRVESPEFRDNKPTWQFGVLVQWDATAQNKGTKIIWGPLILLSEFERREGRRREDTGVEEEEEETEKRSDEKADKKLP